jgi:hypothetical protein
MNKANIVSALVGVGGVALFTILLTTTRIGEGSYIILMAILLIACLAIPGLPRLRELDLRGLKMTLDRIEAVKAGIEELYGGIEHLKKEPFVLDKSRMESLGLRPGSIAVADGAMRYTVGCIKRERERLARVFVSGNSPETIAEAILDNRMDVRVFKWNGPEVPLDEPPTSVEERNAVAARTGNESSAASG